MNIPLPPAPRRLSAMLALAFAALAPAEAAAAERRAWPSEAELTRLQPRDRYFDMGYGGEDLPYVLEPTAVDLSCETVRRKPLRLRCRYVLTVTDWIGRNPPRKLFEDLLERDEAGRWTIVSCPNPWFVPHLGPRRLDPYAGCPDDSDPDRR